MNDFQPQAYEKCITSSIVLFTPIMRRTVSLNNDAFFSTIKIYDVVSDDFLSVKIQPEKLFSLKLLPQQYFVQHSGLTKFPRARLQLWIIR